MVERTLAGASLATPDTRCGVALRRAGIALRDPVDALLASFAWSPMPGDKRFHDRSR